MPRTTPDPVTVLEPGEFFVFGSNLGGIHGAGAAKAARELFGAEPGIGEGLTGRCYAFPTLDGILLPRSFHALARARDRFYATCRALPEKTFLLTRVGCGLAGYDEKDMRGLFLAPPPNVILPEGWGISEETEEEADGY